MDCHLPAGSGGRPISWSLSPISWPVKQVSGSRGDLHQPLNVVAANGVTSLWFTHKVMLMHHWQQGDALVFGPKKWLKIAFTIKQLISY